VGEEKGGENRRSRGKGGEFEKNRRDQRRKKRIWRGKNHRKTTAKKWRRTTKNYSGKKKKLDGDKMVWGSGKRKNSRGGRMIGEGKKVVQTGKRSGREQSLEVCCVIRTDG